MANFWERRQEMNDAINKYSHTKANERIKYSAIAAIAIVVALLIVIGVFINLISWGLMLLLRGLVGLFAIAFVILVAIWLYRIHHAYWKDKNRSGGI